MKITERGWAGHYIMSRWCLFRRNTLIEHNGKRVVVSTVGNKLNPQTHELEEVGSGRYFETMASIAIKDGEYWEFDSSQLLPFDGQWRIAEKKAGSDNLANEMHDNIVNEFCNMLLSNEL